jgi:hypothetical protein
MINSTSEVFKYMRTEDAKKFRETGCVRFGTLYSFRDTIQFPPPIGDSREEVIESVMMGQHRFGPHPNVRLVSDELLEVKGRFNLVI